MTAMAMIPREGIALITPAAPPTTAVENSLAQAAPSAVYTRQAPHVTLSPLDALAVFAGGDAAGLLEQTRSLAQALSGMDRENVRTRLLSKLASAERTNLAIAQRVLSDALRKRDALGVDVAEKVVRGIHARLLGLLRELRLSSERELRPSVLVAVGHADSVQVGHQ